MAELSVKKDVEAVEAVEEQRFYDTKYDDESWYNPNKSEYVYFFPNPRYDTRYDKYSQNPGKNKLEDEAPEMRTDKDKERMRKWIGAISSRPSKKVLVGNQLTALAIENEYKKTKTLPILLPCFLLQRSTVWLAIGVDYEKHQQAILPSANDIYQVKERLTNLESRHVQADSRIKRLEKISQSEDLLVIFDFQNFESICKSKNIYIHPAQVMDDAAKHATSTPRNIISAVVVDFDSPKHILWKKHKYFEFYKVPDMCPNVPNPTDQYIYKATQEAIIRHNLRRGSVVALVSGDHHFIPLLMDLESQGFQTMVISYYPGSACEAMVGKSNLYMNLVSPASLNPIAAAPIEPK